MSAYAKQVVEDLRHAKPSEFRARAGVDEFAHFSENLSFLRQELGAPVDAFEADDPARWDPARKADRAIPGRPAIYVE